jgi:hypothetical protein
MPRSRAALACLDSTSAVLTPAPLRATCSLIVELNRRATNLMISALVSYLDRNDAGTGSRLLPMDERGRVVCASSHALNPLLAPFRVSRDSRRHSSSYRLTTLIVEIESMCVRGDVRGKGIGYPIGADSAWIPG